MAKQYPEKLDRLKRKLESEDEIYSLVKPRKKSKKKKPKKAKPTP
ncbi:hypothetical protein LNTAR_07244 [Lentisphaera araneosa HTCC2155]|jgi:hypothetical protein|uniref:Uncharacterized protein n=1 Tax=Lentisphaera araneosa HTCC2155 TaxID=313628 RepID=A6DMY4_9BACT|nr:hypothetical protein LNTAR_07244 [Lentisphaera araneosa HTCC2155]